LIRTDRLEIVPVSIDLARAEIGDRSKFSELLGASVPDNWPPETLAEALGFFLDLLERNPSWSGWLGWYALLRTGRDVDKCSGLDPDGGPSDTEWMTKNRVLVGSIGFMGAPDDAGDLEIGYSVLPQDQGRGYASEMARGLIRWAFGHPTVLRVMAQTTPDNLGSVGVLRKLGFTSVGQGSDPASIKFALVNPVSNVTG
jgi:ribosomal-protein-alanine N-acetyltransferase